MKLHQICLVLALGIAAPAFAAGPLWTGDLETGDFSQWSPKLDVHAGTTDRLVVVKEPVREGRYASRATVKYGDINNLGARAELVLTQQLFREGDERWFHWYTLFPSNFVPSPKWHLFTQWHSSGFGVPLGFNLHGETMSFRVMGHAYDQRSDWTGGILWKAPLQKGHWNEFLLHVRFSDDPKKGFVELWKDGRQVVPKTFHQTLDPSDYVYLKQGLYRDKSITWDQTLYHDGTKVYAQDPRPGGTEPVPPIPPPLDPIDPGCGEEIPALALVAPLPWALRTIRRLRRRREAR